MPLSMSARRWPKRLCTLSRSRKRAVRNASVAPMLDANDTISKPQPRPKIAPPASVTMVAPGSESAVTAT